MRHKLLVPLAIVAVLLIAAGSVLAAVSVGGGSDDGAVSETRQGAEPRRERERERELDRLLPELEPFIDRLLRELELPPERQVPFVGLVVREEERAVIVDRVLPGSPAGRAGIHEGDVIEGVGGKPVHSAGEVADSVRASEPGELLTFRIRRDRVGRDIEVRVGLRPLFIEPLEERFERARSLLALNAFFEFFEIVGIREGLDERFERLIELEITFLGEDGEPVTFRLLAGTIAEVSDDGIVVNPNDGGSAQEFAITPETKTARLALGLATDFIEEGLIHPGLVTSEGAMQPGDRVLVLTRDESREALAILAFPAVVEELEG